MQMFDASYYSVIRVFIKVVHLYKTVMGVEWSLKKLMMDQSWLILCKSQNSIINAASLGFLDHGLSHLDFQIGFLGFSNKKMLCHDKYEPLTVKLW